MQAPHASQGGRQSTAPLQSHAADPAGGSAPPPESGRAKPPGDPGAADRSCAVRILILNTLAFTVCFAGWMINGVLVTYLVDHRVYRWDKAQLGWLIGAPVLTGALLRLPVGLLADRFGGRPVFALLMLAAALPLYALSAVDQYAGFLAASLGFGLCGASFAVGVVYTSVWFRKEQQGTVLGIFGMGTAGAALTSMGAPFLLNALTKHGAYLDGWRTLPKLYAAALVLMAVIFWFLTVSRRPAQTRVLTLGERMAPLRYLRVWRFGLYYFFLFGSFVAVSQWLIPYYVNVYLLSIGTAGLLAASFSLPAGVTRALGGWLTDRFGARSVLYATLVLGLLVPLLLLPPRMEIQSPGPGVLCDRPGQVTSVSATEIVIGEDRYTLARDVEHHDVRLHVGIEGAPLSQGINLFPVASFRQEPTVQVHETVNKGQLLARGVTRIYFQANVWIFSALVLLLGLTLGIGQAAVFKHVADYFPGSVGVVGGLVGVIGGLGGFVGPIIFGYLLKATGIWTTCWAFLALVALVCLIWMLVTVRRLRHTLAVVP